MFHVKVSPRLLKHHITELHAFYCIWLLYIPKTSRLLMDKTRSWINGSQVQDKEPYSFDVTEQMSLDRSTVAALAVPLRNLQKQDLSMFDSAYSSIVLAYRVCSSLWTLAYNGQESYASNP